MDLVLRKPFFFILMGLFTASCAGAQSRAQSALNTVAKGVKAADKQVAAAFRHIQSIDLSVEAFESRGSRLLRVRDVLVTVRDSLKTAQRAHDAWESVGDKDPFFRAASCVVVAVTALISQMLEAGLSPPEPLTGALSSLEELGVLAEGICDGGT